MHYLSHFSNTLSHLNLFIINHIWSLYIQNTIQMKDKRNTLIKLKLEWILQNIKVVDEYGYQSNLYPMPIKTDLSEQKLRVFEGFLPVMERVLSHLFTLLLPNISSCAYKAKIPKFCRFYDIGGEYNGSCLLLNAATILEPWVILNLWNWLVITGSVYLKRSSALTAESDWPILP